MTPATNLRALLESEIERLDARTTEFILTACQIYVEGVLPENRNRYHNSPKWLRRIASQSKRLSNDLERITRKSQTLPDDLRQAHIRTIPLVALVGLSGAAEYFRKHIDIDPGAPIDRFREVLSQIRKILLQEINFLESEALNTKPLWKSKPQLWWQKGTFEYLLERLFRDRFDLTVERAHLLIINIRQKLDGKKLKFDEDRKICPAIRNAIDRLSPAQKKECDDVLMDTLEFPLPIKR